MKVDAFAARVLYPKPTGEYWIPRARQVKSKECSSVPQVHPTRVLPGTLLISAAFLVAFVACAKKDDSRGGSERIQTPVAIGVAPVRLGSLDENIGIVGTLYGREELTISAKVPGQILKMNADIGDRVPPGGVLAQIDPRNYELAVNECKMALDESLSKLGLKEVPDEAFSIARVSTVVRARFQVENAKAKYERGRKLNQQKPPVMSDQEFRDLETAYDVARSDYDVAQLEAQSQLAAARTRQRVLSTAEQRLADTTVRTPGPESMNLAPADRFAISKRYVSVGTYVDAGAALFDMILDDPVKFRAKIPELYLARIRTGQPVRVRVESYPESFPGEIGRINPAIDRENRTFEIEIAVANPDRKLRPGAYAKGNLIVGKIENVPYVPAAAVVSFAGIDRIFSPDGSTAAEHIVQVGEAVGGEVPVISGLSGVKTVIAKGNNALRNGSKIEVKK